MVKGDMDSQRAVGRTLPAAAPGFKGVLLESPARVGSLSLEVDSPDSAHAARQMTRIALSAWGLSKLIDDAQVCVSELIGNVFQHAIPDSRFGWPPPAHMFVLTLRAWPGWLFVEVADEDSSPPTLPAGEVFAAELATDLPEALLPDRGRGLHIVRSLADYLWWTPRDEGGKSVFCRFDLSAVTS